MRYMSMCRIAGDSSKYSISATPSPWVATQVLEVNDTVAAPAERIWKELNSLQRFYEIADANVTSTRWVRTRARLSQQRGSHLLPAVQVSGGAKRENSILEVTTKGGDALRFDVQQYRYFRCTLRADPLLRCMYECIHAATTRA